MEIVEGKGSSGIDFKGNSMTYRAGFTIGEFNKKYKYESKVSSLMNHATEPRDLVRVLEVDLLMLEREMVPFLLPKWLK